MTKLNKNGIPILDPKETNQISKRKVCLIPTDHKWVEDPKNNVEGYDHMVKAYRCRRCHQTMTEVEWYPDWYD